jgi:drug/metabolite transporter (DMT)-like permease
MFSVLALGSALFYGAADFIGGLTSRRAHTVAIVAISQSAGLLLVALVLPFLPPASPTSSDWIWSAVAGATGGGGVALLYRALAVGVMAVVAPVTAVCAVAVPVIVALALGERPSVQVGAGMVLALVAIALVSQQQSDGARRKGTTGVGLALASGIAIGLFFLALARTSADAGLWPLLVARVVSVTMFSVALVFLGRQTLLMAGSVAATAVAGGILDMLANLLYMLATRLGPLTVAVTLSSLYPASTVMLARVVLGERVTGRQWIGVACALAAIVLIVGGSPS